MWELAEENRRVGGRNIQINNALEGTGSETKMQEIDRVTKPENKGGDIQAKAGDCGGEVTKIKQK